MSEELDAVKDEIVTEIKGAMEDQPLNVLQEFLAFVKGLAGGEADGNGQ